MSLILDALRKMEQERKARSGATADIRPEVIGRPAPPPVAKKKSFVLVAAGVAILVVGIGAGLLLRGGAGKPPEEAKFADRGTEQPTASSAPAPAPQPAAAPPAAAALPVTPAPPQPVVQPAPQSVATPAPVAAPVRQHVAEPELQPAAHQAASDLSVSGIAWQDERSLRRAVVNGVLVGEGSEIAGARVVEIGERRVRFSRGGQSISVSLSSPFPGR